MGTCEPERELTRVCVLLTSLCVIFNQGEAQRVQKMGGLRILSASTSRVLFLLVRMGSDLA